VLQRVQAESTASQSPGRLAVRDCDRATKRDAAKLIAQPIRGRLCGNQCHSCPAASKL
jgi:hypothetical protein